jgi:hypothetical protein
MRGVTISGLVIVGLLHGGVSEAENVKLVKAAAAKQAAPQASTEEIHKAFDVFCGEWMQKLAAREHDNMAHIAWNNSADGVEGEYVGYTMDHTCVVKDGGSAPVGQMTYFEVRYTKRGRTVEEARQSAAEPVERTSVTELFGYAKNKWVY